LVSALPTGGIMKFTSGTNVVSAAIPGVDYVQVDSTGTDTTIISSATEVALQVLGGISSFFLTGTHIGLSAVNLVDGPLAYEGGVLVNGAVPAPTDASYLLVSSNPLLDDARNLVTALPTGGIMKFTSGTNVVGAAVPNTDYVPCNSTENIAITSEASLQFQSGSAFLDMGENSGFYLSGDNCSVSGGGEILQLSGQDIRIDDGLTGVGYLRVTPAGVDIGDATIGTTLGTVVIRSPTITLGSTVASKVLVTSGSVELQVPGFEGPVLTSLRVSNSGIQLAAPNLNNGLLAFEDGVLVNGVAPPAAPLPQPMFVTCPNGSGAANPWPANIFVMRERFRDNWLTSGPGTFYAAIETSTYYAINGIGGTKKYWSMYVYQAVNTGTIFIGIGSWKAFRSYNMASIWDYTVPTAGRAFFLFYSNNASGGGRITCQFPTNQATNLLPTIVGTSATFTGTTAPMIISTGYDPITKQAFYWQHTTAGELVAGASQTITDTAGFDVQMNLTPYIALGPAGLGVSNAFDEFQVMVENYPVIAGWDYIYAN